MLRNLIHPGDWWLLLVAIVAIDLLSRRRVRPIGVILLLITTIIIGYGYGATRGVVHVVIVIALAVLLAKVRIWLDSRAKKA